MFASSDNLLAPMFLPRERMIKVIILISLMNLMSRVCHPDDTARLDKPSVLPDRQRREIHGATRNSRTSLGMVEMRI